MAAADQPTVFIDRQRDLPNREHDPGIEQSLLLLTNCGSKLLEKRGPVILGLGHTSLSVGLGGKGRSSPCFD